MKSTNYQSIPVIAIDGPSASGKGTVAQLVAEKLGYHYLDSGALYRIVALAALAANIDWANAVELGKMVPSLNIQFEDGNIYLNGQDVSDDVRTEKMGKGASEVAVHPAVRHALVGLQHSFRKAPGLVADGRDMATVIFPDATTKIFLTATAEIRAERRYKQLMSKGIHANLADILSDLQSRDVRDQQRLVAPLQQAEDAELLETSNLSIAQAVETVLSYAEKSLNK
ncbi:cytidylate kinase [Methylovorus sp. MM2]|uniref:(d)CMP kinase n=1 Tax=Methylovorus sp. MM2 TaxID=1848038 RepID=UPI0007E2422C|nr:(d)CMP kinase [Methylovorus sp. MM2]OAM52717.1 cytidylate kinase [Methylovorus sp. MM2]